MKRALIFTLLTLLVLAGCASPSTPTMTLEEAAYQEGDLPDGYSKGTARKIVGDSFEEIVLPEAKDSIYITLESEKEMGGANRGGNINILLFEDASDANAAYQQLSDILLSSSGEIEEVKDLGEISSMARFELEPIVFTNIAFLRCNAVAYLLLSDDHELATSYMKNVDQRLKDIACP